MPDKIHFFVKFTVHSADTGRIIGGQNSFFKDNFEIEATTEKEALKYSKFSGIRRDSFHMVPETICVIPKSLYDAQLTKNRE